MEPSFWLERWESNNIGFHKKEANPLLVEYVETLALPPGSRICLPLCGKTRDIAWLLSQGYPVIGIELIERAVEQLFDELGIKPTRSQTGTIQRYQSPDRQDLEILTGNIFEVSPELMGSVDAVYDRAALVALPKAMRQEYTQHLGQLTGHAPQLLLTYEYDQDLMDGPPFSIGPEEVHQHYSDRYHLSLLLRTPVNGGLKGMYPATEQVWLLKPHSPSIDVA